MQCSQTFESIHLNNWHILNIWIKLSYLNTDQNLCKDMLIFMSTCRRLHQYYVDLVLCLTHGKLSNKFSSCLYFK